MLVARALPAAQDSHTPEQKRRDLLQWYGAGVDSPALAEQPGGLPTYFIGGSDSELEEERAAPLEKPRPAFREGARGGVLPEGARAAVRAACREYLEGELPRLRRVQDAQASLEGQMQLLLSCWGMAPADAAAGAAAAAPPAPTSGAASAAAGGATVPEEACEGPLGRPQMGPATEAALGDLRTELCEVKRRLAATEIVQEVAPRQAVREPGAFEEEVRKVKVLVAAVGARFDKQMRSLERQVEDIRLDSGEAGARWPGRKLAPRGPAPDAERASEAGSLAGDTLAGSTAGCSSVLEGMSQEERDELKKIRMVVGAAGAMFSKDLRDLRAQVKDVREEMESLRSARGAARGGRGGRGRS
ncbi:unnamed protein product [Prorocentrum cordatum]|uniref:Uncharacterized protein n=1 Tax=Prorocentrum cordatum TaxID=2364126 RepID=A0ABN9T084_9DINO|nr:unnamed protein product [Polarella glacialis]